MEVSLTAPNTAVSSHTGKAAPELEPLKVADSSPKAKEVATSTPELLGGPGVRITRGDSLVDQLVALRNVASPDQAAALSNMMKGYYDTMMNTAKNMGLSEDELKLRERRKEELEKQIQELEAKKITVEDALIRFENTFLAAEDKELLEANMAKQRPITA